ncbi:hypothetical protein [Halobaculum sp. MBLA0143]|uniref:hypothetical protein n=1 Tax=Halobaculum sp. MBLA0143 TaxID=3079933 RepID=UPI003524A99B
MSDDDAGYGFPDEIPIDPIAPRSTVLVARRAVSRVEDLVLSLVAAGSGAAPPGGCCISPRA